MTVDKKVPNILVLGGGIVGLNTALRLQKDYPRAKITIMAENWLDKTVSQVARPWHGLLVKAWTGSDEPWLGHGSGLAQSLLFERAPL